MLKQILFILGIFSLPSLLFAMDATYYSDDFEGGYTANGDVFSQSNHSAALCAEELGQFIYVSRGNTGMTVLANDRPNCTRYPNLVDLSRSAFESFAPLPVGRIPDVSVEPLAIKGAEFSKRDLSQETFSDLGVSLARPLGNTYFAGESIIIAGKVGGGEQYVMTYVENKKTGKKVSQSYLVEKNGSFRIGFSFPVDPGEYYWVIAAGTSFRTNSPADLLLIDRREFTPQEKSSVTPLSRITLRPETLQDDLILSLSPGVWGSLQVKTGSGILDVFGQALLLDGTSLPQGKAQYTFTGYTLATPSSLDRSPEAAYTGSGEVTLERTHDTLGADRVRIVRQARATLFRFRLSAGQEIFPRYYVTLPNGDVRTYEFPERFIDSSTGLLRTGVLIQTTFPTGEIGTYKLEVNDTAGFAYFNLPIIRGNIWNIIPPLSSAEIRNIKTSPTGVRIQSLTAINLLRSRLSRTTLSLDPTLTELAQKKAEDMALYNYVGHTSHSGQSIRDFGVSLGINIPTSIGENVAGGNVSGQALQLGLEDSGSHRSNMIDPEWNKVGIGFVISGTKTYMVQVFGE